MRSRRNSIPAKVIIVVILVVFLVWTLFPMYWMFSTSIKPTFHVFDLPPEIFPSTPTLEHYLELDQGSIKVSIFFMNSVINSIGTVLLAIVLDGA